MSECEGAIRVVGTASNSREAMDRMASLRPDVLVMRTEGETPTTDFRTTVLALGEARLAGRAVLTVSHLAGFLGLATKAGAAGLLPVGAPDDVVVQVLREVRARFTETTPVGLTRTMGEPTNPKGGGGEM